MCSSDLISAGKYADLTAVDLSAISTAPCYDPVSHIVYAAGRENVTDVWVQGRRVVDRGELLSLDKNELLARSHYWRDRLQD